jgi:hypothetical protein
MVPGSVPTVTTNTRTKEKNKMAVFWVVAPCSSVEVYDVSEVLAASIIAPMMEATSKFKMICSSIVICADFNTIYIWAFSMVIRYF